MGVRVKPFRQYFVEGTYRMPTHYVEVFADPTDKRHTTFIVDLQQAS